MMFLDCGAFLLLVGLTFITLCRALYRWIHQLPTFEGTIQIVVGTPDIIQNIEGKIPDCRVHFRQKCTREASAYFSC